MAEFKLTFRMLPGGVSIRRNVRSFKLLDSIYVVPKWGHPDFIGAEYWGQIKTEMWGKHAPEFKVYSMTGRNQRGKGKT